MKRRIALLAGAAMLSTIGMLAPASPASANADPDACAGTGTATLSSGLGYPGLNPSNLVNFFFNLDTGTCATKGAPLSPSLAAVGHVHGWCGHSTGSGITNNGASFHFVSAGGTLVVFGHVDGVVNATPDPTTGSCTNKMATKFIITGAVTLQGAVLMDGCANLPATWNCL